MKLSFFGATQTVTGSKYLVEEGGRRYLVDCGLFQGVKELRTRNRAPFPINPKTVSAVVLTHAHIDHTGYLPLLVKLGFKGPVYGSQATCDLCKILLTDSARLQEEDARIANRLGYSVHVPALPLYTEKDAEAAIRRLKPVEYDRDYTLNGTLTFNLSRSGHILGSSFVLFDNKETRLLFSGDLGRPNDPIMIHPESFSAVDYLVLESTYGNRLHQSIDVCAKLEVIINETIAQGGSVIVPAFAVGRSQTLLYYINKLKQENRIPADLPVYLDSPMAQAATDLWCRYTTENDLTKKEADQVCSIAHYVQSGEESMRLNSLNRPAIIISASGMAEGGRVVNHIKQYGPFAKNTIIFAGYQAEGTRGDRMLRGDSEVKIQGEWIPVNARIENIDALSSHADYSEIIAWLKGFQNPPKTIFLTHGESGAAESLRTKIVEAFGWKVVIPRYLEAFDLSS